MRLRTATVISFLLFGVLAAVTIPGAGTGRGSEGRTLPLPPAGGVAARYLDDGWPVFVVASDDGDVSVVSAINPHMDLLAVWCLSSRTFVEVGPASRFDERGRYVGGPAPRGLTPYHAEVIAGQDSAVLVGGRGEPPGRDVPPLAPSGPECQERSVQQRPLVTQLVGVVGHDLNDRFGDPLAPEAARRGSGRVVRLDARLSLNGGRGVLCSPRRAAGCPQGSVRVESYFHPGSGRALARCSGDLDTEVLARRTVGGFADVAVIGDFTAVGQSPTGRHWGEFACDYGTAAEIAGVLVAVEREGDRWAAVVQGASPPDGNGPREDLGTVRVPFENDAVIWMDELILSELLAITPGQQMPQLRFRQDQIQPVLDEFGPQPVDLVLREGKIVSGSATTPPQHPPQPQARARNQRQRPPAPAVLAP